MKKLTQCKPAKIHEIKYIKLLSVLNNYGLCLQENNYWLFYNVHNSLIKMRSFHFVTQQHVSIYKSPWNNMNLFFRFPFRYWEFLWFPLAIFWLRLFSQGSPQSLFALVCNLAIDAFCWENLSWFVMIATHFSNLGTIWLEIKCIKNITAKLITANVSAKVDTFPPLMRVIGC